jgi:hypothetical protein
MRPVPVAGAHPVGREDELEALAGFLDPDSLPRAAVLAGEAGIGKDDGLAHGRGGGRAARLSCSRVSPLRVRDRLLVCDARVGGALPGRAGRAKCK